MYYIESIYFKFLLYFIYKKYFVFCLFRAAPTAYGNSQARGRIRAVAASLYHSSQQLGIRATSATYTTAHSNAGSLIH